MGDLTKAREAIRIQRTFNKVFKAIEKGERPFGSRRGMCSWLEWASDFQHIITSEEARDASLAIKEYLRELSGLTICGGFAYLSSALAYNELPNEVPDREAIYKHWAKRPYPKGFTKGKGKGKERKGGKQ